MSDRNLVTYVEPREDDGPFWILEIDRSASGRPGLLFTIRHEYFDSDLGPRELTVVVEDGSKLLEAVNLWLQTGERP